MDSSYSDRRYAQQASGQARSISDGLPQRALSNSRSDRAYTVRALYRPMSDISLSSSSSEVDLGSPLSEDVSFGLDKATPPPNELRRHSSGLPPTPPTLNNSQLCTVQPDEEQTSAPVYADRTRNALGSRKTSTSTPVLEAHSPPTPDPSPPGPRKHLAAPPLVSAYSASSRTESFRTAREELPVENGSHSSRSSSNQGLQHETRNQTNLLPVAVAVAEIAPSARPRGPDNFPSYVSSLSGRQIRPKSYQRDSDSDIDGDVMRLGTGARFAAEGRTPSPAVQRAMAHRAALQQLRDTVRSGAVVGVSKQNTYPVPTDRTKARRGIVEGVAAVAEVPTSKSPSLEDTDVRFVESPLHANSVRNVHEATLEQLSGEPPISAPTPAAMAFLENNNHIYKLIQAENVKRHSGASDGSVQVMVMSSPEMKRALRHSPKRLSLRAEPSKGEQSPPPDVRATHALRHKRGFSDGSQPTPQASPQHMPSAHPVMAVPSPQSALAINKTRAAGLKEERDNVPDMTAGGRQHQLRRTSREHGLDHGTRSASGPARMSGPIPTRHNFDRDHQSRNDALLENPKLRKSSAEQRLENNLDVRRTALERLPLRSLSSDSDYLESEVARGYARTTSSPSVQRRSLDRSLLSPGRRSSDTRYWHSSTPHSIGQISDRTVELCEARGVEMFPHSNNSLLVVQQSLRPSGGIGFGVSDLPNIQHHHGTSAALSEKQQARPMTPAHAIVDSPLTNPRAAPAPPTINYIPPTPSAELDFMFGTTQPANTADGSPGIQRKLSLKQKVRRYSENLMQPLTFSRTGSVRRQVPAGSSAPREEARPTYLSSMWTPRDFWEEYDSDDSYDDVYEDEEGRGTLPPGGDTSDVPHEEQKRKSRLFPRNLSVRMPGFRGDGGFLIGNSLGIDRHGTNRRRHYVTVTHRRSWSEPPRKEVQRRRVLHSPSATTSTRAHLTKIARNILMTKAERERAQRIAELKSSIGPVMSQG